MTTSNLLKRVETCRECKGTGMVQHPAWKEYWKEHPMQFNTTVTEDRAWFEAHGWSDDLFTQTNGLPDEEIPCVECEGAGKVESEVDLKAVLAESGLGADSELTLAFAGAMHALDAFRMNLFEKTEASISAREALESAQRQALLENKFDGKNEEIRKAQAHDYLRVQYADLKAAEHDERRAKLEFDLAQSALDLLRYRLRIAELTKDKTV